MFCDNTEYTSHMTETVEEETNQQTNLQYTHGLEFNTYKY